MGKTTKNGQNNKKGKTIKKEDTKTKEMKKPDSKTVEKENSKKVEPKEQVKKQQDKSETKKVTSKKEVTQETNKKDSKENKKSIKENDKNKTIESKTELKKLFVLIGIISAVFLVFYGISYFMNKQQMDKIFKKDDSLGSVEFDYSKILVGTMKKQNEDNYYVLAIKKDKNNEFNYSNLLAEYANYKYEYKIYTIDLDDVFNKNSIKDESDFTDDKVAFKKTTLIEIENGEIKTVYEADSEIEEVLNELLEEAIENTEEE